MPIWRNMMKSGRMISCTGTTSPPMKSIRVASRPANAKRARPYAARQARSVLMPTPRPVATMLLRSATGRFASSKAFW